MFCYPKRANCDRLIIRREACKMDKKFNELLKSARLKAGLTQAQLAEMVGTSAPYLNRLIKKEGIVNKKFVDMLDKLGYDIQLSYIKREQ